MSSRSHQARPQPGPSFLLLLLASLLIAPVAGAQVLPDADAGSDETLECADPSGTSVMLDGSGSTGTGLSFAWTSAGILGPQPVTGETPTVDFSPGVHVVTLEVTDAAAATDTDQVIITVEDTTAPELVLTGDSPELWPPNHDYHSFHLDDVLVSATDECDGDLFDEARFQRASSDEEENGRGDGNTEDDIVIGHACRGLDLRAERSGRGDGRVYRARVEVEDASGNQSSDVFEVTVRHDRRPGGEAVNSGVAYTVVGDCDVDPICPDDPGLACFAADRSRISIRSDDSRPRADHISWIARGFDSDFEDFGDPTSDDDYELCVYVEDGVTTTLETEARAPAGRRWREGRSGLLYRARRHDALDGLRLIRLRTRRGESDLRLLAIGPNLEPPVLPLPDDALLHVQLHNADGECWDATFEDPIRNDDSRYRARFR